MGMRRNARWAAGISAAVLVSVTACTQTPTNPPPTTGRPPTTRTTTTSPPTTTPAPAQNREGYWNLTGDVAAHDPSIAKSGSTWYVFTTGAGISMTSSADGLNWGGRRKVFSTPPAWWSTVPGHTNVADAWAPDIKRYNGRYFLFYALSSFGSRNSAIGYATAATPAGPWTDHGSAVLRTTDSNSYNAIDPELVIDANGDPWLAFGSFWDGLMIEKLDRSTMVPNAGTRQNIARRSAGIEAASIVYRNGYYYLFASIDKCCQGVNSTYKIVVSRSTRIDGGYVDKSGKAMTGGGGTVLDAGNDRWRGPGGEDVNEGNVIARHAYDATANGAPKLLINGLRWDSAGWPVY
jgi:arabinan endo-1,5-alpha-L-arabinosidase